MGTKAPVAAPPGPKPPASPSPMFIYEAGVPESPWKIVHRANDLRGRPARLEYVLVDLDDVPNWSDDSLASAVRSGLLPPPTFVMSTSEV